MLFCFKKKGLTGASIVIVTLSFEFGSKGCHHPILDNEECDTISQDTLFKMVCLRKSCSFISHIYDILIYAKKRLFFKTSMFTYCVACWIIYFDRNVNGSARHPNHT